MAQATQGDFQHRAGVLLEQVAGYIGHRTVQVGLQHDVFGRLAAHPDGVAPEDLAEECGLDPFYLAVWCRSAYAAGVLEATDGRYRIDPITATLLVDRDSPAYVGALFPTFDQPEVFDLLAERLPTGERTWWDRFGPEFIRCVAGTSRPATLRLIPGGFAQVPGLEEALIGGGTVLELACGAGFGLVHLAGTYPSIRLVGVDGDAYSLTLAASALEEAGHDGRAELVQSPLEELDRTDEFDLVVINLSMHECRDIDRVTDNVRRALRPGGTFVISDFPFPDTLPDLRTVPGRIMSGIQFVEAQIDDQLLPTQAFVDLLERYGFESVDSFDITSTHAVTHGRLPARSA